MLCLINILIFGSCLVIWVLVLDLALFIPSFLGVSKLIKFLAQKVQFLYTSSQEPCSSINVFILILVETSGALSVAVFKLGKSFSLFSLLFKFKGKKIISLFCRFGVGLPVFLESIMRARLFKIVIMLLQIFDMMVMDVFIKLPAVHLLWS